MILANEPKSKIDLHQHKVKLNIPQLTLAKLA